MPLISTSSPPNDPSRVEVHQALAVGFQEVVPWCHLIAEANSSAVRFAVRWKSTFQYVRMSFCTKNIGS